MDELRKPFLVVALVLMVLVVLVEVASPWAAGGANAGNAFRSAVQSGDFDDVDPDDISVADVSEPPGRGIFSMIWVDGMLAFRIGLMGLALVVPARLLGRVQGIATLILSLILLILGIIYLIFLIIELTIMVSLFLAVPFGTLAYLAKWGFFPTGEAETLLTMIMGLKLATAVFLVLAQQRFLKIKMLILLVLTSLLANVILAFLYAWFPNPLTSILDELGAIVIVILGLIWLLLALLGSIPGIIRVLRVDRALARS